MKAISFHKRGITSKLLCSYFLNYHKMAEETKVGEGENLNSEGQGDQAAADAAAQAAAEAAKDQKTTFTLDEVEAMKKKMQSDGDK